MSRTVLAAMGFAAALALPALAQQQTATAACPASNDAQARTTDRQLLDGLLKRRAEIMHASATGNSSEALAFLDKRIAEVKARIAACTAAS